MKERNLSHLDADWIHLMEKAKNFGLHPSDIRKFLNEKKEKALQKNNDRTHAN
ncbi:antirepressor SinI [Salipaludibacillus neizhouensis]|uniref:Antirepressor SinI n=1 Tax=Salipaludibacillus neizhouensis TaxID=885475 RepID=A0A3A9K9N5_9BACI|nr:anti-repressor SinI family protein [Salipaludibacillus neizhouensis]RKL67131.1 antirepressor SinI [Salipaludibacillus neizhouensis]